MENLDWFKADYAKKDTVALLDMFLESARKGKGPAALVLERAKAEIGSLRSALSVSQAQGEVMRECELKLRKWAKEYLCHAAKYDTPRAFWGQRNGRSSWNKARYMTGKELLEMLGKESTPPTAVGRVIEAARDLIADVQARYPGAGTAEPFRCPIMQRMSEALAVLDGRKG